MLLDSPGDILAILSILAIVLTGLLWLIKAEVAKIGKEMQPNHGTSFRDAVDAIADSVDDLRSQNDRDHERLTRGMSGVNDRLDAHMEQPAHNRRRGDAQQNPI